MTDETLSDPLQTKADNDTSRSKSEAKELFANSSWVTVSSLSVAATHLIQSIVIARELGVERYGAFVIVGAFVGPILELCNPNLASVLLRFGTQSREQKRQRELVSLVQLSYLLAVTLYMTAIALVGVLVWLSYDLFFRTDGLAVCAVLFVSASALSIIDGNSHALLRMFNRFRIVALMECLAAVLGLVVVLVVARVWDASVSQFVLVVSTVLALRSIAVNLTCVFELRGQLRGITRFVFSELQVQFRRIIRFVVGNSLALTIEKTTRRCDMLVLSFMVPQSRVAVYDVARKISTTILLLRDPIALAAFPQVARLIERKDFSTLSGLLKSVYRVLAIPSIFGLFVLCVWGSEVAGLWGSEFKSSGWTVQLLSMRSMMFLIFFWTRSLILSLGMVRFQLRASILSTAFGFCIAIPLTLRFGADGMALAMLLATMGAQVAYAYVGLRTARSLSGLAATA